MPDIKNTTRAQTLFLRAFRTSPTGPAPADWPAPAILRKWLRKPGFRAALASVREGLRFQADFHLSNAATQAAQTLFSKDARPTHSDLARLLRLSHLRQRFAADAPSANPAADPPSGADDDDDNDDDSECLACIVRRRNPFWIEDEEAFKQAAFKEGYTSPLRDWPDFPPPTPQDTFYYQLIQTPQALLRYMQLYDRAGNDHRFQPILLNCKLLLPHTDEDLPKFQSNH